MEVRRWEKLCERTGMEMWVVLASAETLTLCDVVRERKSEENELNAIRDEGADGYRSEAFVFTSSQ